MYDSEAIHGLYPLYPLYPVKKLLVSIFPEVFLLISWGRSREKNPFRSRIFTQATATPKKTNFKPSAFVGNFEGNKKKHRLC
jgi:hypothetical protein